MRFLGLDIGKKTIGVAVSDPDGTTALPLKTISRRSFSKDLEEVVALAAEYSAGTIVAGLPLNMDGTRSAQTEFVQRFLDSLKKSTDIPIVAWDERLSTVAVTRALMEGDMSRAKRKEVVDMAAASYILQGYLDSLKRA